MHSCQVPAQILQYAPGLSIQKSRINNVVVPLALGCGIVAPVLIGFLYHDAMGALVWASLVKSLMGTRTSYVSSED